MCVEWVDGWEVAAEDITAYKVVSKGFDGKRTIYCSPTQPSWRADQGYGKQGDVLTYKLGKKVKSDEPGVYCLTHAMALAEEEKCLLEVIIPKGTKIRRGVASVLDTGGRTMELRTINALCVKVVKEFKGKIDKRFMWPTTQVKYHYQWNYVTTAATSSTSTAYWPMPG